MALAIPLAQIRKGGTICPPPPPLSVVVTTWTERSWKKINIISLFGGSCELNIFSFSLVLFLFFIVVCRLVYAYSPVGTFLRRLYLQQFNSSFPPLLLLFTQLFHTPPPTDRWTDQASLAQKGNASPLPPLSVQYHAQCSSADVVKRWERGGWKRKKGDRRPLPPLSLA